MAVRASHAVRMDGVLDEASWSEAPTISEFTQLTPNEGESATQRTVVRVLYDDEALYFGAYLYDTHPITTRLGRRDMSMAASDWLTLILDSHHDHRTGYGFEVNPSGVRRDQTREEGREDDSWDPVWQVETTVTDSGWIAELRIPFSQLRFSGNAVQTWGIQFERTRARNQEFAVWSFTPPDQAGGIARFGHLNGLQGIPTGRRLEVLPYTVARAEHIDRGDNRFRSDREYGWNAGLDLKYRVSSDLTLNVTVNPDFGQVEVDPADVNLTAFETFYPEKRPFFIEGAETYRFGEGSGNSMFYSRRIGRRPTIASPYAERDVPEVTRILAAAKMTGRLANGWSVGLLNAMTRREMTRFVTDGETGEAVAEPLTNYFAGRARREFRAGQTAIGTFIGAVNRRLDTEELANALPSAAYSAGVDLSHQWDERTWTLEGFVSTSHVQGEASAMEAVQRMPYRYFHRPDAGHLALDPHLTALSGLSGKVRLAKRIGRHWNGWISGGTATPGYEVNDLGFQRRADRIDLEAEVSYSESRPGDVFRRYLLFAEVGSEYNFAGENVTNNIFAGSSFHFLNYWSGNVGLSLVLPGTVDDRLTRGGPAARRPGSRSLFGRFGSDVRKPVAVSTSMRYRDDDQGGFAYSTAASLVLKPTPTWEVSLGPSVQRAQDVAQYLRAVVDPAATQTFGTRYVFASVDRTTVALESRLNYTFSPRLSVQAFVQPFVASGEFGAPKEFARPGSFDFLSYGGDVGEIVDGRIYPAGRQDGALSFPVPQPDFNVRSLRGSALLRWEWGPGSTLYLAWQQTRESNQAIGSFDLYRDADALFSTAPDNVFHVKLSYWLNP